MQAQTHQLMPLSFKEKQEMPHAIISVPETICFNSHRLLLRPLSATPLKSCSYRSFQLIWVKVFSNKTDKKITLLSPDFHKIEDKIRCFCLKTFKSRVQKDDFTCQSPVCKIKKWGKKRRKFQQKAAGRKKSRLVPPCSSEASSLTFTALVHVLTDLCKRLTCWCYSAQALPFYPPFLLLPTSLAGKKKGGNRRPFPCHHYAHLSCQENDRPVDSSPDTTIR